MKKLISLWFIIKNIIISLPVDTVLSLLELYSGRVFISDFTLVLPYVFIQEIFFSISSSVMISSTSWMNKKYTFRIRWINQLETKIPRKKKEFLWNLESPFSKFSQPSLSSSLVSVINTRLLFLVLDYR